MPPRNLVAVRLVLGVVALSLVVLAVRKGEQARRFFSPLIELPGTVVAAELTDAIPLAQGNPRAREVSARVPTRLTLELREYPGLRFQVALREDPNLLPAVPAPGEQVALWLPRRWTELKADNRALAMGLSRSADTLVDPAGYPYSAEYRTAFLAVGAAAGALIAGLGAWKFPRA